MRKVAIQGIKASFHEEAALKYFGNSMETVHCDSFRQTCKVLDAGMADYAVMAIENSIAGSLLPNYSLINEYKLNIIGEVYLPIHLQLMGTPGVDLKKIKMVMSHPIALRQCVDFLEDYPNVEIIEGKDTAACAKKLSEEKLKETVAIANSLAAEVYGLQILSRNIESDKKNYTRFLILKKAGKKEEMSVVDKASICFQIGHHIGALTEVLQIFSEQQVNLSKIQSMPVVGKPDDYYFYVDLEWTDTELYNKAIAEVLRCTTNLSIMGEYQKALRKQ